MGELREPLAFTYAKVEASHYNDSLAVDPTNPDVGSSGHPGGVNAVMGDGSVRFLNASITDSIWIDMGAPPADGYLNPSSFQIIAAGKGAVQEDGLLLPAVQDDGEASIKDGTTNTVMIGEVVPTGRTDGDSDGRDFLVWQRGGAPSSNEIVVTKVTDVSSTALFREDDSFDFSQSTTEPTAPQVGNGPKDWIKVESCNFADNAGADGKGYLLTSIQHSATDTPVVDQSGTEASSRLFVGNLTLNSDGDTDALGDPITFTLTVSPPSPTAFPGFAGGVSVASGDVNGGDNQPDLLVGVSGSDTFNFQPQLTTEPTAPEPYMQWKLNDAMVTSYQHSGSGGDLLMNADLLATPGPDDGLDSPAVQKGAWIMDATYPGGTPVATEPGILEGHQCLVFFLG